MGLETQIQELEKQLLSTPRIFVDTGGFAFFDVYNPTTEPIDVAEIKDRPVKSRFWQPYNFLVENTHYFRIGEYNGPVRTVSVTIPCIIFCGYTTDENGRIKSSGVYHFPSGELQGLSKLIDTLRSEPNEEVTIKAAGAYSYGNEKDLQKIRYDITKLLAVKHVKIKPEHFLLGGYMGDFDFRVTEFDPRCGQLITYIADSKQKTIL